MPIEHSHNILMFLNQAEQLKQELRHSWTSGGRQESVADHSWRLAVMLVICAPHLGHQFNLLKALKIALFHDLGEAKIGDKHYLDITDQETRVSAETNAVRDLTAILPLNGASLFALWKEFADQESPEAKVVYFLDKLEACIQHNEADIATWTQREIDSIEDYFNHLQIENDFLLALKKHVLEETKKKLTRNTS